MNEEKLLALVWLENIISWLSKEVELVKGQTETTVNALSNITWHSNFQESVDNLDETIDALQWLKKEFQTIEQKKDFIRWLKQDNNIRIAINFCEQIIKIMLLRPDNEIYNIHSILEQNDAYINLLTNLKHVWIIEYRIQRSEFYIQNTWDIKDFFRKLRELEKSE